MLAELKFVQGAVAKKDFIPSLSHFVIENGTVRGYNGMLALCTPIPFDIECKPKAEPLVKAISNCTETVQLALTAAGRLSIKSGKFKAFVDCHPDESTPHVQPEGEHVVIDGAAMLQALKVVYPFIGDDASRPWSNGVLLLGQSAFATNNITLVEYWTGSSVPKPLNIPRAAIKELLRIDEAPEAVQMTETSITFHFTKGRWLRTQLFATQWPDLTKVLGRDSDPQPLDDRLFEALKTLKPFTDKAGRIIFRGAGKIATHDDETEGAGYEIDGFDHTGVYQIDMLNLLNGNAKSIDWSAYPSPCMFFGDRLRGAIIGMKQ
jgi:DNA polymerase III sliding clamp (beta) subunit (PCNA family)